MKAMRLKNATTWSISCLYLLVLIIASCGDADESVEESNKQIVNVDFYLTNDSGERMKTFSYGEDITFVNGKPTDTLEILVRDHQEELLKHLRNNFITIVGNPEERFGNKIAFQINDSEGNTITLEANK